MHIFLISMPWPSDRRASGLTKVKATGLTFELVDGVETAKWLSDALPIDPRPWGRPLLTGEVGCYLAHLRVLQRIVDYNLPWACILEDDFCFEADPDFKLHEIESTLPRDFHYVHLQRDIHINPHFRRVERHGRYDLIHQTPYCTVGYIITNPLAQYVLEHHSLCRMPIDHLYSDLSNRGRFYAPVKPLVGCQLGLTSDIHANEIVRFASATIAMRALASPTPTWTCRQTD